MRSWELASGQGLYDRLNHPPVDLSEVASWRSYNRENPTMTWRASLPTHGIWASGDTPAEAVEAVLDDLARRQGAHFDASDQCATVRRMSRELNAEGAEALDHRRNPDHD